MAYTTINKPSDYFNTVLYTGNGTGQSITGVNFQPDFVWTKRRNTTGQHFLQNIVQGTNKALFSDSTSAEFTGGVDGGTSVTSFDSDGFTLGTEGGINGSGGTFASWNWLASNTTASNTDGSITSTVSANTTSGFSIVSYTGTGASATVGHGLSSSPKMVIVKKRDGASTWLTYNANIGNGYDYYLSLNSTAIANSADATVWNNTNPTSTVFSLGNWGDLNGNGSTYIAYCFAEVKGFSKFGSYTGNGSADGPFVYTGFKPAFVILKRTDGVANWQLNDSARDTFNVVNKRLAPSASDAEATNFNFGDFLSNGFKIRQTDQTWNASGGNYIYMAFAENPLVTSTKLPATAR